MSDPSDIGETLRKQGRAAVAAQAAAEAALEGIGRLEARLAELPDALETLLDGRQPADGADREVASAFLPVADALRRVISEAEAVARPERSVIRRVLDRGSAGRLESLLRGLHLLESQLDGAFRSLGVTVDRATGVRVDASRHRVVEARRPAQQEDAEIVVEIVRPGYHAGDRVLREADVIATRRG